MKVSQAAKTWIIIGPIQNYGHPGEAAFEPELIHVLVEDVRENGLRAA